MMKTKDNDKTSTTIDNLRKMTTAMINNSCCKILYSVPRNMKTAYSYYQI